MTDPLMKQTKQELVWMVRELEKDRARVEAWERMNRKGCRPGCEYDPDRGFIGWGWKHDTYKTWREAMDAAMEAK